MKLNFYWPSHRRRQDGSRVRRKAGPVRRFIKRVAPTWAASPWRRLIQTACLALFLTLLLVVCWFPPADTDATMATVTPATPAQIDSPQADDMDVDELEDADLAQGVRVDAIATADVAPSDAAIELEPGWPTRYADVLAERRVIPPETFLRLDPLVSITTAIAARAWISSLIWAGVILAISLFIPRGFCGYVCPLGTLADLFDWIAGGVRRKRRHVLGRGWWVYVKYYLLAGLLVAAILGVTLSGFLAAIPVITRGLVHLLGWLQVGVATDWAAAPPLTAGHFVSIALLGLVLLLGVLGPRFWCRCVCPTGAVFSLAGLFGAHRRHVSSECNQCGVCATVCSFDAIRADRTTRAADCAFCQTCGGVCPIGAISFADQWGRRRRGDLPLANPDRKVGVLLLSAGAPAVEVSLSRRGFLAGAVAAVGVTAGVRNRLLGAPAAVPIRPPGSVPEREFLQMCVRCGQCIKVCPSGVIQPMGLRAGLDGMWTPQLVGDRAGCEPSCNNCGQVCPTGAIRALPLAEKRFVRVGRALVDEATCLPWTNRDACLKCKDVCDAAGYRAITIEPVLNESGEPGDFMGPVIKPDRCVGCGLCQAECHRVNVADKRLLETSAVVVHAGKDQDGNEREDRMGSGSYRARRQREAEQRQLQAQREAQQRAAEQPPSPPPSSDPDKPNSEFFIPD